MGIIDWIVNGWKKVLIYLGIAAVVFSSGLYYGYQYHEGKEAQIIVKEVIKEVKIKDDNQATADNVGKEVEDKKEKTRIVYKTIAKEIIRYVEKPESKEPIGSEWVCLFNKSAAGVPAVDGECDASKTSLPSNPP